MIQFLERKSNPAGLGSISLADLYLLVVRHVVACRVERLEHVKQAIDIDRLREHGSFSLCFAREFGCRRLRQGLNVIDGEYTLHIRVSHSAQGTAVQDAYRTSFGLPTPPILVSSVNNLELL